MKTRAAKEKMLLVTNKMTVWWARNGEEHHIREGPERDFLNN